MAKVEQRNMNSEEYEDWECCTICGKPCDDLECVDDETHVCAECLAENFTQCSVCGEYWSDDMGPEMHERDGKMICDNCWEEEEDEDEED